VHEKEVNGGKKSVRFNHKISLGNIQIERCNRLTTANRRQDRINTKTILGDQKETKKEMTGTGG